MESERDARQPANVTSAPPETVAESAEGEGGTTTPPEGPPVSESAPADAEGTGEAEQPVQAAAENGDETTAEKSTT
jgi:hypothetical protein